MERADRLRKAFDYVKSRGFVHTQKDLSTRMQASEGNVSKALKGEEQILTDSWDAKGMRREYCALKQGKFTPQLKTQQTK